jgi:hypothetical protein
MAGNAITARFASRTRKTRSGCGLGGHFERLSTRLHRPGARRIRHAVRALDRALTSASILIPLFHLPAQWIARWASSVTPKTDGASPRSSSRGASSSRLLRHSPAAGGLDDGQEKA